MRQTSADGVDIPRQNSVIVFVWGAHECPSRMGEVDDGTAVGVICRCGIERERGARNVRYVLVVVRVDGSWRWRTAIGRLSMINVVMWESSMTEKTLGC